MTDLTRTITVNATPDAVFAAINRPRNWWGKEIEGVTDHAGEEWTYRYKDMHFSRQRTSELVPGKRVVWEVLDSQLSFLKDKSEWNGTRIVFDIVPKGAQTEIRFTHVGLSPQVECYDMCSDAWSGLLHDSLKSLIEEGQGAPDTVEKNAA